MKHKTAFVFLLFSALLLHGCVVGDKFSDEGEFDYSIVLDDLTSSYNRYRLWYDDDGSFLLLIGEDFTNQQPGAVYLTGKLDLDIDTLNAARQRIESGYGTACVQVLLFDKDEINHETKEVVCDEGRNGPDLAKVLEYFDKAFEEGTPREGPSETNWANNEYSLPSTVLTYSQ